MKKIYKEWYVYNTFYVYSMNPSLYCTMYMAGRAWKRSTSEKRRPLRKPLVIYLHELFVYGYAINLVGICLCRYVRGCVQSCDDIDGCNSCHHHHQSLLVTLLLLLSLVHLKIN